jgi:Helix-turn-helix domain
MTDSVDRLTEKAAAEYLDIPAGTLRNWRFVGKGPAYFRIGSAVRYEVADLDAFVQRVEPASAAS